MQLVGYMSVMNGAEFMEYSIRSTIPYCDRFIVLEGAWGCNILANGQTRSADGTIEILSRLQKEFPKLEVYHMNKRTQLEQRTAIFDYIAEPSWIWLIDHDEVYDTENAKKVILAIQTTKAECIKINSLTFINDFYHYVPIAWNRLYFVNPAYHHLFIAPNEITKDNQSLVVESLEKEITYFHYSYLHSKERFIQKRRERILLHGEFKWNIDDKGLVYCHNTNIREYTGQHPGIMKAHSLYGIRNV